MNEAVKTLSIIQDTVSGSSGFLNAYLSQMTDSGQNFVKCNEINKKLQKTLDEIEKSPLVLSHELRPFKTIIENILKAFAIMQGRVESADAEADILTDIVAKKTGLVNNLKNYIEEHQELLKQNNISIPEFKPLEVSLQSNVKGTDAYKKRLDIIKISQEQDDSSINEWLNRISKAESQSDFTMKKLPKGVLKTAAKEAGVNIAIGKNEVNKVVLSKNS